MNTPPLALALETSSRMGSVALGCGPQILAQKSFSGPLCHSTEILPTVEALLHEIGQTPDEIIQVYLSIGPGSFTGLRIAVSLAKTMHLANHCQIVPVSSLSAVAANVQEPPISGPYRIGTVLDAKRNQFFVACYGYTPDAPDQPTYILAESLLTAEAFLAASIHPEEPLFLLGDGLVYHQDKFTAPQIHILDHSLWSPQATEVYKLGWSLAQKGAFADPLTLVPNYVREALVTPKIR